MWPCGEQLCSAPGGRSGGVRAFARGGLRWVLVGLVAVRRNGK